MASRSASFFLIAYGLLVGIYAVPASGDENAPETWDRAKAATFLEARGEEWFNFGSAHRGTGSTKSSCVSCHSLLSYALARPVLRGFRTRNSRPSGRNNPRAGEVPVVELG